MKHRATPDFWDKYRGLPVEVQRLADANYELLRSNPRHPSLRFKKIGRWWSVRVGSRYRAVGIESGSDMAWFWIGTHAEYDQLIDRS